MYMLFTVNHEITTHSLVGLVPTKHIVGTLLCALNVMNFTTRSVYCIPDIL